MVGNPHGGRRWSLTKKRVLSSPVRGGLADLLPLGPLRKVDRAVARQTTRDDGGASGQLNQVSETRSSGRSARASLHIHRPISLFSIGRRSRRGVWLSWRDTTRQFCSATLITTGRIIGRMAISWLLGQLASTIDRFDRVSLRFQT